jgi:hypothetical protein
MDICDGSMIDMLRYGICTKGMGGETGCIGVGVGC